MTKKKDAKALVAVSKIDVIKAKLNKSADPRVAERNRLKAQLKKLEEQTDAELLAMLRLVGEYAHAVDSRHADSIGNLIDEIEFYNPRWDDRYEYEDDWVGGFAQ
jgi:hypothetical protein